MDAEKELEQIEDKVSEMFGAFAEKIRQEHVIPFCKKYKMRFVSGMGTFFFVRIRDNEIYRTPDDDVGSFKPHFKHSGPKWEAYCSLYKVLRLFSKHINGFPIGTWIGDYNP